MNPALDMKALARALSGRRDYWVPVTYEAREFGRGRVLVKDATSPEDALRKYQTEGYEDFVESSSEAYEFDGTDYDDSYEIEEA